MHGHVATDRGSRTLNKVDLPPEAAKRVLALMHPGSTHGHHRPDRRRPRIATDPGFTIMTHDDA